MIQDVGSRQRPESARRVERAVPGSQNATDGSENALREQVLTRHLEQKLDSHIAQIRQQMNDSQTDSHTARPSSPPGLGQRVDIQA